MLHRSSCALAALALVGCASTPTTATAVAPSDPSPTPAEVPTPAAVPEAKPFEFPGLITAEPATDAPAGLAQFGRLVGVWTCASEQVQPDGSFKPGASEATWTWFYTLSGHAVQDIWEPVGGAVGTNLRVYDPDNDTWEIQWVTGSLVHFQLITARAVDDTVVMHGDAPAAGGFPAHARRITFHGITEGSFDWKYEATKSGTDTGWSEFSRMHCTKTQAEPLARSST
jgi:hypothetical protein